MGMPGKESPVKLASLLFFEKFNGASRGERRLSISRSKIMKVYLESMRDFAGNPKWHRPE